jgi:site-specific recombinase XerD
VGEGRVLFWALSDATPVESAGCDEKETKGLSPSLFHPVFWQVSTMPREKKVFAFHGVRVQLYAPADLRKRWFLYYYEGSQRRKKYGAINRGDTYQARLQLAEQLAEELCLSLTHLKSLEERQLLQYLEDRSHEWRKSTLQNVSSIIRTLFTWLDGRPITRPAMEQFFEHLKGRRHPTTYNNYRQWLHKVFRDIGRDGLLINVHNLKTQKTPARYFQPHQIARLREVIQQEDPELWLYIQFIYYCFLRPSRELPKLQAGDILMEEREILVPGHKSKNKKSQYVAIPDVFFKQLAFVYELGPAAYLFPSRINAQKPIGRNTMNNRHSRFLQALNFGAGYSLYSWKHTGAVMAIKAGIGVKELQLQLRHYSLDETDKYLRQMGVRDIQNIRHSFPDIHGATK